MPAWGSGRTQQEIAEDMAAGAVFPPIVVFFDGAKYWLADGFHRIIAAEALGLAEISADVREGTRRDAILYAVGANADHGLKRSRRDKRNAVLLLLKDPEWTEWSDREIARRCTVSDRFVNGVRAALTPNIRSEPRTYTTKHGTTATMTVTNIGAKPKGPTEYERQREEWARAFTAGADDDEPEPEWRQTDIEDFTPGPFANVGVNLGSLRRLFGDQPMGSIGKPVLGAIEDRAENFYAKMPKPEPPQAESALGPLRSPRIAFKFFRQFPPPRPLRAMWRLLASPPKRLWRKSTSSAGRKRRSGPTGRRWSALRVVNHVR